MLHIIAVGTPDTTGIPHIMIIILIMDGVGRTEIITAVITDITIMIGITEDTTVGGISRDTAIVITDMHRLVRVQ
ncbi:MAG: hypothetical protein PF588_05095 [Candidatus Kapabacteria bacterium]|jgi:hypothetical protein|nr:hypothetical protein [Candidatus Kapabacteria bacterium]